MGTSNQMEWRLTRIRARCFLNNCHLCSLVSQIRIWMQLPKGQLPLIAAFNNSLQVLKSSQSYTTNWANKTSKKSLTMGQSQEQLSLKTWSANAEMRRATNWIGKNLTMCLSTQPCTRPTPSTRCSTIRLSLEELKAVAALTSIILFRTRSLKNLEIFSTTQFRLLRLEKASPFHQIVSAFRPNKEACVPRNWGVALAE